MTFEASCEHCMRPAEAEGWIEHSAVRVLSKSSALRWECHFLYGIKILLGISAALYGRTECWLQHYSPTLLWSFPRKPLGRCEYGKKYAKGCCGSSDLLFGTGRGPAEINCCRPTLLSPAIPDLRQVGIAFQVEGTDIGECASLSSSRVRAILDTCCYKLGAAKAS